MKPRICVPLVATDFRELVPLIERAEVLGADLLEVRLDYLNMQTADIIDRLGKVIGHASVPVIATNRQHKQGGHKVQREDRRIQALIDSANIGFQYIDIESTTADLESVIQQLKQAGSRVMVPRTVPSAV